MRKKKTKQGFTLVELSIAIVFISILLLTIATVTLNMIHSYHKGMAMKSINSVGLALIDEFSSAFSESPVFSPESLCRGDFGAIDSGEGKKCMDNGAMKYVYQSFIENVGVTKNGGAEEGKDLPTAGVFCTGKYSYVWNTGYVLSQYSETHSMTSYFYHKRNHPGTPMDILKDGHDNGFRLSKYLDTERTLCSNNFPKNGSNMRYPDEKDNDHKPEKANIETTIASFSAHDHDILSPELINTSDIALYSLTINKPVRNDQSGRVLFSGSFVLGSITGDIDLNYNAGKEGEYSSCNLEGTSTFDVEYCATNKFNFAIRAMGGNSGS